MSNNAKNLPEVKLGQYKGLAVTRHVPPLSPTRPWTSELVHQTRMRAVYHPTTEPAKRGFRALLDFAGYMDGKEIPDSRMEKVMVVLGDGKLMPAAEAGHLRPHALARPSALTFTYPEQFRVEELSGKTAQFEIKLHSVAEKTTPGAERGISPGHRAMQTLPPCARPCGPKSGRSTKMPPTAPPGRNCWQKPVPT